MKTLIQGGYVVAFDGKGHKLLKDGVVVYEGDKIIHVGKVYSGKVDKIIEAKGRKLISPGFVDCESVAGLDVQVFATDVGRKDAFGPSAWNFAPTKAHLYDSKEIWENQEREDAANSAEFGTAQCLKSGITTLVATSAGRDTSEEDPTVRAIGHLGGRGYVARPYQSASYYVDSAGTFGYHWNKNAHTELEKGRDFAVKYEGAYEGRINTMLFPYRLDACTPELLRETKTAAQDMSIPIRIHTAQFLLEFYEILRRHQKTPVQFLADIGFLGPDVLLHHAIFTSGHSWLAYPDDGTDLRILADTGVSVSHSPLAFARRAVALESFHTYQQAGINLAFGTDTFPPDMMMHMRVASTTSKIVNRNVNVTTAGDVYNAATLGGAEALGREDLGRLMPNAKADIIIVDLEKMHIGPVDDPIRSLVHLSTSDDIMTVIIDGRTVVQDGIVLELGQSESELLEKVQLIGLRLKDEIAAHSWGNRTADEMFPPSFPIE